MLTGYGIGADNDVFRIVGGLMAFAVVLLLGEDLAARHSEHG
jgi:hypothetical protein